MAKRKVDKNVPAHILETDYGLTELIRYATLSKADTKVWHKLVETEDYDGMVVYQRYWVKKYFDAEFNSGYFGVYLAKDPNGFVKNVCDNWHTLKVETHQTKDVTQLQ